MDNTVSKYINRYILYPAIISENPAKDLETIIVVPVYRESKFIFQMIESLLDTNPYGFSSEVIFVINDHEGSTQEDIDDNDLVFEQIRSFNNKREDIRIWPIRLKNLRPKIGGVGHARKAGMDEAVRRFKLLGKNGIILCLDADCQVADNYISTVYSEMYLHPDMQAASIHYEHQLDGLNRQKILEYELHLRYFIDVQKMIKLPFAYHTVGSSIAVRSKAYAAMGGMNQKKAGEDFYFLQKFIAVDKVFEINNTCVYPSDRQSDRVPFGTGKAIYDLTVSESHFQTYNLQSFKVIARFIELIGQLTANEISSEEVLQNVDPHLKAFLESVSFETKIQETKSNTTNPKSFLKRFFQWFNAFQFMKAIHFLRDRGLSNKDVRTESLKYINSYYAQELPSDMEALMFFRERQKA